MLYTCSEHTFKNMPKQTTVALFKTRDTFNKALLKSAVSVELAFSVYNFTNNLLTGMCANVTFVTSISGGADAKVYSLRVISP